VTDHDDLVAKYTTPLEDLPPELRERILQSRARVAKLREEGKIGTPEQFARQNFPLGLDDNYVPFPVRPDKDTENDPEADYKPRHGTLE
jgi:hypothetical protein